MNINITATLAHTIINKTSKEKHPRARTTATKFLIIYTIYATYIATIIFIVTTSIHTRKNNRPTPRKSGLYNIKPIKNGGNPPFLHPNTQFYRDFRAILVIFVILFLAARVTVWIPRSKSLGWAGTICPACNLEQQFGHLVA